MSALQQLKHLVRKSTAAKKPAPGIILLHGYGSNEEDLFSFAPELPDILTVISVRAPFTLPPFGYAWFSLDFEAPRGDWSNTEEALVSRDLLFDFIDEAITEYDLDPENITLLGFSQGAGLVYALGLSKPEKFRNIIALSGYLDVRLLVPGYEKKDHSRLSIYLSHGQVDQVIPPEMAYRSSELLNQMNMPHTFEQFPVGHGVSPQNFHSFNKWLKERI